MRVCVGMVLAVMFAFVASAGQTTVVGLVADAPPVLDGKLDDAVWQQGEWHTGFQVLNTPGVVAQTQTHFKIAFDNEAVYVAVRAEEPQIAQLRKQIAERDGKVFMDDCVEVMIGPRREPHTYMHIIVNALGTVYDSVVSAQGNDTDTARDLACRVGVAEAADAWCVELAVPLSEFGLRANAWQNWVLNVARERYGAGEELSTFVPLAGGFHRPDQYAKLTLPDLDLHRLFWAIEQPEVAKTSMDGGSLVCKLIARVQNQTGVHRDFTLRLTATVEGTKLAPVEIAGALDADAESAFSAEVRSKQQGTGHLRIEILAGDGEMLAVCQQEAEFKYEPIRLEVTRPWYRNSIYATETVDTIHARVHVGVRDELAPAASLNVRLSAAEAPETAVAEKAFGIDQEDVAVVLPLPELPLGDYTLTAEVRQDDKVLHTASTRIRKLPPADHEWRIDEQNVLLHNGTPFMPFGMFSTPVEEMASADCPYNIVLEYGAYYWPVEKVRALLDEYAAAGKFVTIYPYPNPSLVSPESVWSEPLSDEDATALRERVRALKDHPALFAWYMADEPELRPASVDRVRRIYEVVADEDPYHPCIMLNDTIKGIFKYVDGGDVLMPDPYPCFLADGLACTPIEGVSQFIEACGQAGKGRKPAWVTPQAFNYGDYGKVNNRPPTFVELRNMTYQAVAHGAKGFLYYTWSPTQNYMDLKVGMPFLARECLDLQDAILADAILAPEAEEAVNATGQAMEHVHCSARRVGNDLYVFAVNTSTEPQTFRFELAGAAPPSTMLVVSEDRHVTVEAGAFTDEFAPYATHVYTTDERLGGRPTVAAALDQIAALNQARHKPGNLAFEDTGVTLEVSSRAPYSSTPERMLDGILDGMGWRDGTGRKVPDWVELTWPEPIDIGRVVLYTDTVAALTVAVPEGDGWQDVCAATGLGDASVSLAFPPVHTDRLRLTIEANRQDEPYTQITEIEVFAK